MNTGAAAGGSTDVIIGVRHAERYSDDKLPKLKDTAGLGVINFYALE
jgi:hypothetical protein